MTTITIALVAYTTIALLYWSWTAYSMFRLRREVPVLSDLQSPSPSPWPSLSVIVPACNEADKIESAARSLLNQDYPNLEIILVNDRSTDDTGPIIDRLAAQDPCVIALHISDLPPGWLGKVNALRQGLNFSRGEFALFTDADVHFQPSTLRQAVAFCQQQQLDFLTALPNLWPTTFWLDSAISVFIRNFLAFMSRPWALKNPRSRAFVGIGAFNMVRRTAFKTTAGFEWLRREVADDMGLGLLMKKSGARCAVVSALDDLGLHWYRSFTEAARGTEKAYATLSHFSILQTFVIAFIVLGLELSPILSFLPLAFEPLRLIGYLGIVIFGVFVFSIFQLHRWSRNRILPALLGPLASISLVAMFVRAGLIGRCRRGINWRDTHYSARTLRDGMRITFLANAKPPPKKQTGR